MMQLVIEDAGNLQVVNLDKDELEITIGRREGSNIRLSERNVSRQHAILTKAQNQVFIEDFSRYGTKVNGRKLEEAERVELKHGDELNIGDFRILLEDDEADEAALATAQAQAETLPERDQPMLVAISSNFAGKEYKITRPEVIIGRAPEGEADITIDDRSISRHHAKVARVSRHAFTLQDLDSANGVKVRGRAVKEHALSSGDIIELGQVKFRYCEPGEIWFFDPKSFPQDAPPKKPPPPPPPKSNGLIFAIAGVVVIGLIAAVVLVTRPDDKTNTTGAAGAGGAAPVDTGNVTVDAKINSDLQGVQGEIDLNEMDTALTSLKALVQTYPPEQHPTVKRSGADLASQIAQKHLAAAAAAPDTQSALSALTKSSEVNTYALSIDPNFEDAKARSTTLKGEQDALPKILAAEQMLTEARSKNPPDRVGCKDAAEKLSMLVNSPAPIPITKALAAKSAAPASVPACVEASYSAEIEALLSAKNTAKAKPLVEDLAKDIPSADAKVAAYRRRINDIENPRPDRPDTPPEPPPDTPSVDNSALAAEKAAEADKIKMSNPTGAIKLYKESLKLKNNSKVRGDMASVMMIGGLFCDAAKEFDKVGNASKAAEARAKGGCP